MNKLKPEREAAVLRAIVEGSSVRSTERMTGVNRDTILRVLRRVGSACESLMDSDMRGLRCERVQLDEIWCYVGKKQKHIRPTDDPAQVGDFWTFVALDADTKLVPSFRVGKRDAANTQAFVRDLASRIDGRIQLSSDMLALYVEAVEQGFGGAIDYGRIVKSYEAEPVGAGRYSPPKVVAVEKDSLIGCPDPEHISTSYVERQNLTIRMSSRRFTRLTNAFSKRVENLRAAVALHFAYYNYVRRHRSLRVTPCMAAGMTNRLWRMDDLVSLAR